MSLTDGAKFVIGAAVFVALIAVLLTAGTAAADAPRLFLIGCGVGGAILALAAANSAAPAGQNAPAVIVALLVLLALIPLAKY